MFNEFPKTRPSLPKKLQEIYATYYKLNREGQTPVSSVTQKMESWLHKQVAKDIASSNNQSIATLEVGAGTLNQLEYEPNIGYYDIVEPFRELYKNSPFLDRIGNIYSDISQIPESCQYNRITSIATFEHICDLPSVVARCGLLLANNGTLRVSIPSEGTFLWTLGWKLTTGIEFKKKYGLDYGLLMKHEHVNTAREIENVLRFFFKTIKCKSFGLSKSISFYRFYECLHPQKDKCSKFLES